MTWELTKDKPSPGRKEEKVENEEHKGPKQAEKGNNMIRFTKKEKVKEMVKSLEPTTPTKEG